MPGTLSEPRSGFDAFRLHSLLQRAIALEGFTEPRPIQQKAIPAVLEGRDVLGLAQTGTGKTVAFALPILERLLSEPGRPGPRVLIVAPTRELAMQIDAEITSLARFTKLKTATVYGGVSERKQIDALARRPEIVVACPGRFLDLHRQGALRVDRVEVVVLDEADHMLDMGFLPDIRRILAALPAERQNLLFSATMPAEIRSLASQILRDPVVIELAHSLPPVTIEHALYPVPEKRKLDLLTTLLDEDGIFSAIVFTRTKHRAKRVARELDKLGHRAVALQGNMSQNARDRAMSGFRSGRYDILVATDIVARGIDVEQISHVINFDVPNTPDAYTHRIGRTGRSERSGKAYTFVTEEDRPIVRAIERKLAKAIPRVTLPGFEGVSIPAENFGGGLPEFRSPRAGRRGAPNGEPGRGRESRFQDGKPNRRERGEGWSSETRSRAGGRENGRDGQRSRAGRDGAVRDGAGRAQGPRDSGSFRDRSRPERGDGRRENGRRRDDGRERAASGPRGDRREQARGERRTGDRSAPARPSGRGGRFDRGAPEMERGGRRGPRKAKRPPRRGS